MRIGLRDDMPTGWARAAAVEGREMAYLRRRFSSLLQQEERMSGRGDRQQPREKTDEVVLRRCPWLNARHVGGIGDPPLSLGRFTTRRLDDGRGVLCSSTLIMNFSKQF